MIRYLSSKIAPCSQAFRRNYYSYAPEPFHPLPRNPVKATAEEAIKIVKSGIKIILIVNTSSWTVHCQFCLLVGDTIFVHSAAATPLKLLSALAQHGKENKLEKVTVCHIHIEGEMEYLKPEYQGK